MHRVGGRAPEAAGAVVDASTGANYSYPNEIDVTLTPIAPLGRDRLLRRS
jgi:hypothetical protein